MPDFMKKELKFEGVQSDYIKQVCREVYEKFTILHSYELTIFRRRLRHTTMQAQPRVDLRYFLRRRRRYRIDITDQARVNRNLEVAALPRPVLKGWIAHEMGHLVDYLERSAFNLMRFGISYLTSEHFRIGAERMADLYAIEFGYGPEVLATKKFILRESGLPKTYLERIERYYMSPEELELILSGEVEERVRFDQPELRPWDREAS